MSTPDSVKYSNTPTATENVWGAGLKDAKRQSPSTALADVAQSVTGVILGIFLFCHMAFTSLRADQQGPLRQPDQHLRRHVHVR